MVNRIRITLHRLRSSFSRKAERAYAERDAARGDSQTEAYAQGEGHAYAVAEEEVREAEKEEE